MSPFVPFTSFGLLESFWLVGGVFSALKALRSKRRPAQDVADTSGKTAEAEPADTPADRAPIGRRDATPESRRDPQEVVLAESSPAEPQAQPPQAPTPAESHAHSGVDQADEVSPDDIGLQILVAEDNPINRKVMQLLLRRMGYEADIAIDGQEAVEMAISKPYDAILMDLHMPRMGGIEATEAIVAKLAPPPRVVAVTADVTQQARDECQRVGMVAYLTKPVDSHLLLHELKEAEAHRASFRRAG